MNSGPTLIPLYSDEKALIEREIDADTGLWKRTDSCSLVFFYELERIVAWVKENGFKKVALQFPDHLLVDSAAVSSYIEANATLGCRAYVLADTSYGKCCVDEVASEHISADSLIHFGTACLSANARLPVLYIFGRHTWNSASCAEQIKQQFEQSQHILVFYDVQFHYGIQQLEAELATSHQNIIYSEVQTEVSQRSPAEIGPSHDSTVTNEDASSVEAVVHTESDELSSETTFCGRTFKLAKGQKLESYVILYIGGEGALSTNILMHYNQLSIWNFDPTTDCLRRETISANRALMKRFFLIEKAKDADIVGIVVGTLAVSHYLDMLKYLKRIIREAGKKYYLFVMGKLNIPKLANFAEIDIFVLVACPENSLLDSKEFFRPVVTPFELEIALVRGKEWSNQYTTDFAEVLKRKDVKSIESRIMADGSEQTEAEDVRISLIANRVKHNHKSTTHIGIESESHEDTENGDEGQKEANNQITRRDKWEVAAQAAPSASTVFLQRSFQGLQQRLGEDTPHVAQEGRAGIASGYEGEGN